MEDKEISRRKQMFDEIAIIREPSLEMAKLTHKSCQDFAQNIIKSGILLNGGAIVALPAITSIFISDFSKIQNATEIKKFLLIAVIAYLMGLLIAWLTGIIAYFAACVHNRVCLEDVWNIHGTHYEAYNVKITDEHSKFFEQIRASIPRGSRNYKLLRVLGIFLSFLSYVAFMMGSVLSGYAFSEVAGLYN